MAGSHRGRQTTNNARSARPRTQGVPLASGASNTSGRSFAILVLFALAALLCVGRVFWLTVVDAPINAARASEARSVEIETTPRRGTIYDRNGVVLATSVDATTIYANPSEVTDAYVESMQLASILGGKSEDYKKLLSEKTTFVYIKRKADVDVAKRLEDMKLDGVYFIEDTRREYPNGRIGAQVIGFCNIDGVGLTGLESYYDDILKGTPGKLSYERGMYGIPIPGGVKEETPAVDGQDIMISIDIDLQNQVEFYMEDHAKDKEFPSTQCVITDGATGEIYAAASMPLFDPTKLDDVKEGATNLRGITNAFEPGSVFKTVTAMAALEADIVDPEDEFDCPARLQADEYYVSDSHARDDATFTFREIINKSSNVGISLVAEKLGFTNLYNKIIEYGLNEMTGVDYFGEASGYLLERDYWSLVQGYNVSFGQGVSVTPVQLCRFYGAINNNGLAYQPHFLMVYPQTGERPQYRSQQIIQNTEAIPTMDSMLQTVVTDGTATPAAIDGYKVAGKTGTAEIADEENGGYKAGVYNLSFIGYISDSTSKLVCFVGAGDAPFEGTVTPLFHDIMSYAIDRFRITPK